MSNEITKLQNGHIPTWLYDMLEQEQKELLKQFDVIAVTDKSFYDMYVSKDHNGYLLTISTNKRSNNAKLYNATVIHEHTHLKQILRGDLELGEGNSVKWKGKEYTIVLDNYLDYPWEKEARQAEYKYLGKGKLGAFFAELNQRILVWARKTEKKQKEAKQKREAERLAKVVDKTLSQFK